MTARQQRRAQERIARKKDTHLAPNQDPSTHLPELKQSGTNTNLESNPPPSTPSNSNYTALAAARVAILLPGEDADTYRTHLLHLLEQHGPETGVESVIVGRLADLQWRLRRIATLEAGIMALGRRKYVELFTDADPATRIALLDAHTLAAEGLVLKNLHTQEARLRRYYATDLKELAAIQQNRQNPQAAAVSHPAPPSETILPEPLNSIPPIDTDEDGFEFSNSYELDLSDEPVSAACLQSMFGFEFSHDAMCAGTASAENG